MRQNIKLVYSNSRTDEDGDTKMLEDVNVIYLYSHWGGDEQYKDSSMALGLKRALERKERWDDESYLARIIFESVIGDEIGTATGYGLAPYEVDPEFPTITVNLHLRTVDGMSYEDFINAF